MTRKEKTRKILDYLAPIYGNVETELDFATPFQLLVATVLSAQCTDKRVNMVTPALFADYPDATTMAEATPEVIYEYVRSVSYPNSKAAHLCGLARMLRDEYGGEVPQTLEELVPAWRWAKDGKRGAGRSLRQVCNSRRYARFPREPSTRTRLRQGQHTLQGRDGALEAHSRGRTRLFPLLAAHAWALRLHVATAKVREMRTCGALHA